MGQGSHVAYVPPSTRLNPSQDVTLWGQLPRLTPSRSAETSEASQPIAEGLSLHPSLPTVTQAELTSPGYMDLSDHTQVWH